MQKVQKPRPTRRKPGRPQGITVTETDHAVVERIADLGLQNYQQLREGVLKDRHRVAVWNRMKRLTRAGLVRECRDDNGRILAWTVTQEGARLIYKSLDDAQEVASQAPIYRSSFEHDRILVDVRRILSECKAVTNWEPETALRKEVMRKNYRSGASDRSEKIRGIPDAILWIKSGGKESKGALELELTQKSKKRWYRKLEAQITSSDFDHVFYICKDESLKDRMMDLCEEVSRTSPRVRFSRTQRNGIYFSTLPEVLETGLQAKFESSQDSLSFGDLG